MATFESEESHKLEESLRRLPGDLQLLVEKRLQLFALNISEVISDVLVKVLFTLIALFIFGIILLLLVFAISFYLGAIFNNLPLGFLVTALPLLLIGLALIFRKPDRVFAHLKRHLLDTLIRWVYQKETQIPK